jgi:hypothetical protein
MAGQQDADGASRFERDDKRDAERDGALLLSSLPLEKRTFEEVRKEEKKERRAREKRKSAVPLPDDWRPNEAHYAAARALGRDDAFVDGKAVDLRLWAQSKDERKVNWDATFHGFLRRDASNGGRNGQVGNHNAGGSALAAVRQLRAGFAAAVSDDRGPDRTPLIGVSKG